MGILADKIGYKKTMILCSVLYFVSKIVFWKANGFGMFLIERVILSVVMAGMSGVDTSILYLSSNIEKTQGVFGIYNNLSTVGLVFAAGIHSIIIKDNYRLAGLLTVISYGVAAVLVLGLKEVRQKEMQRKNQWKEFTEILPQVLRNKSLLLLLLSIALLNETHQTITVFLNQLQYIKCDLSTSTIGIMYIIVTIAGLFGGFSSRITKWLGYKRLGVTLFAGCTLACLILTVTESAIWSFIAIGMIRINFSLFQPLQLEMQNKQVIVANRATALSLNTLLMEGTAVSTNLIFGSAAESNLSYAMLLGATFCMVGLFLYCIALRGLRLDK